MGKKVQLNYAWDMDVLKVSEKLGDGKLNLVAAFDFAKVPETLDVRFLQIGRRTKVGNFATEAETTSDKVAAMKEGFAMLCEGRWEAEGGHGGPTVSVEAEAIARLKKITVAQAQKAMRALKEADGTKYEALLKSKAVTEMVATIKAEKAESEEVDLSDLS